MGKKKVKKSKKSATSVRYFKVGDAYNEVHAYRDELDEYIDVLMGRNPPPIHNDVMTLTEVANAYYSRAQEMNINILRSEAQGEVKKGDVLYRFRTGELRAFLLLSEKATELGSRRLTAAKLEFESS